MSRSSCSQPGWCLVMLFSLVSASAGAEPASSPWHSDVNIAWAQTKALNRPMLLLATTDNCLYCEQLKQTTFAEPGDSGRIAACVRAGDGKSVRSAVVDAQAARRRLSRQL